MLDLGTTEFLEQIERMRREFGPAIGAMVGVLSWPMGSDCLVVTPDKLDEQGERFLEGMLGSEAVEIARRHRGQQVVFMSEQTLRILRDPTPADSGAAIPYRPQVYHLLHRG